MTTTRTLAGVALLAATLVPAVATSAPAAAPPRCQGQIATVVGTAGDDRLHGTAGRDVIVGLGGADVIEGAQATDWLCGGPGKDVLRGGRGSDLLQGNRGDDRLLGGSQGSSYAGDVLNGGPGDDLLDPGRDTDPRHRADSLLWTGAAGGMDVDLAAGTARGQGADTLVVGGPLRVALTEHDDRLVGSRWAEEVAPGHGADTLATGGGDDVVRFPGGPGPDPADEVRLGPGADELWHVGDGLTAYAGPGDDLVVARGSGTDAVHGGAGADRLRVRLSTAPGQVVGGDRGDDEIVVARGSAPDLTWDMASGAATIGEGGTPLLLSGLEGAVLDESLGSAVVTGTPGEDRIVSRATVSFSAGDGDDLLSGSAAADTFDGGSGHDTYVADLGGSPNSCTSVEEDPTGACEES